MRLGRAGRLAGGAACQMCAQCALRRRKWQFGLFEGARTPRISRGRLTRPLDRSSQPTPAALVLTKCTFVRFQGSPAQAGRSGYSPITDQMNPIMMKKPVNIPIRPRPP
jgi:hypothetical protein